MKMRHDLNSFRTSSTTSVSACILEYRKLHGRTYQNFNSGTEYWCVYHLSYQLVTDLSKEPNDKRQNDGLNLLLVNPSVPNFAFNWS